MDSCESAHPLEYTRGAEQHEIDPRLLVYSMQLSCSR